MAQWPRRTPRFASRPGTAKGASASTATIQRQKLSATGSKPSRSARPSTQLPAHMRLAAARTRKAVARDMAGVGLAILAEACVDHVPVHDDPRVGLLRDQPDRRQLRHVGGHVFVVAPKLLRQLVDR